MGHKQLVNQGHHLKLTSYIAKFIVGMSNPSSGVLVTKDLWVVTVTEKWMINLKQMFSFYPLKTDLS